MLPRPHRCRPLTERLSDAREEVPSCIIGLNQPRRRGCRCSREEQRFRWVAELVGESAKDLGTLFPEVIQTWPKRGGRPVIRDDLRGAAVRDRRLDSRCDLTDGRSRGLRLAEEAARPRIPEE